MGIVILIFGNIQSVISVKERIIKLDTKGFFEKFLSNRNKRNIVVVIGLVGIILIFISNYIDLSPENQKTEIEEICSQPTVDLYKENLESELTEIVSNISGAGNVKILITMDSTTEDVYAVERSLDEQSQSMSDESKESAANEYSESDTYVKIKNKDGSETLIKVKQVMPKIRGVLIVCDGGGDSSVKENITRAVSGVLNISSGKVYVTN